MHAGGLRINRGDYGNTIYHDLVTIGGQHANIGFTLRNTNSFNFNSFSIVSVVGYTNIMSMNTTAISLNKPTNINSKVTCPNIELQSSTTAIYVSNSSSSSIF